MLVVDTLRKNGLDASATKIRDYILNLKGWTGVNGTYDLRAFPQRGVEQASLVMVRWDSMHSDFVAASKTGGRPL